MNGTRPQTIAAALSDSPVASWPTTSCSRTSATAPAWSRRSRSSPRFALLADQHVGQRGEQYAESSKEGLPYCSRQWAASSSSSVGGDAEDALALLGDGDGLQGFHVPLRTATMRYAKRCARYGNRDDDNLREKLRAAIRAATRRPDRTSVDDYLADQYLQRLIDGAFALLAGNEDIQAMQPQHAVATEMIETTRTMLEKHINEFLVRVRAWHAASAEGRAEPEHAALVTSLGSGKSSLARAALPQFIAEQKAAEQPHRVLWTVPTHRLGSEALEAMADLGLRVAVLRGRDADDPDASEPGV